jgi:hypothetical protein
LSSAQSRTDAAGICYPSITTAPNRFVFETLQLRNLKLETSRQNIRKPRPSHRSSTGVEMDGASGFELRR